MKAAMGDYIDALKPAGMTRKFHVPESRPDAIVLVIRFRLERDRYAQLKRAYRLLFYGGLTAEVEKTLGYKTIALKDFSVLKFPVESPIGILNKACGAVGVYDFIGLKDDLEPTLKFIGQIMRKVLKRTFEGFELYTAYEGDKEDKVEL